MKAANAAPSEPKGYIAADVPQNLVHPAPTPERQKTSVLAFLVKALSLALEEHPIMRSRVREADGQRWLDVSRDANIGIAVSGEYPHVCPQGQIHSTAVVTTTSI